MTPTAGSRRPAAVTLAGLAVVSAVVAAGCSGPVAGDATPARPSDSVEARTTPAEPRSFTVVGTGDVLIHPELTEQSDADDAAVGDGVRDFRPLLAGLEPVVAGADLALCHLEVPLANAGGPFSGYPSFNAPPELTDALVDTGYDGCSTASNHVLDQGTDGVKRTLDAMDAARLRHTGSARTSREARTPLVFDVGGVKVGHVSFTYGFNGIPLPADQPWLANQLDPDAVLAAARAARKAGAEVVIASLHWGVEYRHDPTEEQLAVARRLLDDDAIDLILGHHAHVVQPIERVNGKWVAYGMGNSVARHDEPRGVSEEGVATRFTFVRGADGWAVDRAEYIPTLVELGPPIRLIDLTDPAAAAAHGESLRRTDGIVLSRGAAADGLTRPGS